MAQNRSLGLASVIAVVLATSVQAQAPTASSLENVPPASTPGGPQASAPEAEQPLPDIEQPAGPAAAPQPQSGEGNPIVVTGIRQSLERAAEIKRNALQIVDSIVAQDIGKLPDPTTAAALQRVPGVQVSVNRSNELGDVRIRGLPDVLTTVNGREIFTTTGRSFDLQDLPAEALARVDVYKSQTPDLIEGGLAGIIDLELNKPFSFKKPTVVLTARGNYGLQSGKGDPQIGALLTKRWDTPIGEIGALINATYSRNSYERDETILLNLRSTAASPLNTPGLLFPNILQNFPEVGHLQRAQVNGALQWQVSPSVEAYADFLYTRQHDCAAHYGANVQAFTTGTTLSNVVPTNHCILARVNSSGQNPTISLDAQGNPVLQRYTLQNLCYPQSATLNNPVANLTTQARNVVQANKSVAGGVKYDQDGTKAAVDVAYQTSRNNNENIQVDIGQRVPTLNLETNDHGIPSYDIPGDVLDDPSSLYIRNSFGQTFALATGHLFQAKADASKEVGGILNVLKVGLRYADRAANSYSYYSSTPIPGGNLGTAGEAQAVTVSATGLPADFLTRSQPAPALNGGASFYVPNPGFLLSDDGQDALRSYFGLPLGRPAFQNDRQFNADEKTISAYAEVDYKLPVNDQLILDGVVGGRFVQTKRSIRSFVATSNAESISYSPITANTTDRDFLPTATARLRIGDRLQARLGYSKSIRRPDFTDLNPVVTLSPSGNPFVQSGGSAGNPKLKEQKSDSYDATLEYYFHGGYVSLAAYDRSIDNRVITGAATETYDGVDYSVARPRNLGRATLKGLELSAQYFAQNLPGAFSGLGVQGAFTLADSKIGGDDPLAGNPLQGVSKYNFTAGLLYEKYGISGRIVYTYRSKYFVSDQTGSVNVRAIDPDRIAEAYVPTSLAYVRPAGRLDFSIGYDINRAVRIDVGGTNVLRSKTRDYLDQDYANFETFYDETTYTVGVRVRL